MSLFISPQDYVFGASECVKKDIVLCGHSYSLWCKKENQEKIDEILAKIEPIIEKMVKNNKETTFEKVLLMTLIDIMANKNTCSENNKSPVKEVSIANVNEFDLKMQDAINDFSKILEMIISEI